MSFSSLLERQSGKISCKRFVLILSNGRNLFDFAKYCRNIIWSEKETKIKHCYNYTVKKKIYKPWVLLLLNLLSTILNEVFYFWNIFIFFIFRMLFTAWESLWSFEQDALLFNDLYLMIQTYCSFALTLQSLYSSSKSVNLITNYKFLRKKMFILLKKCMLTIEITNINLFNLKISKVILIK